MPNFQKGAPDLFQLGEGGNCPQLPPESATVPLSNSRSSRCPAKIITNTDFADNIALISDTVEKSQLLLHKVELAAETIGLHINETKTDNIVYCI